MERTHISDLLTTAHGYHSSGNHSQAFELYQKVLTIDENELDALLGLLMISYQIDRLDICETISKRIIKLNNNIPILYNILGVLEARRGNYINSKMYFYKALHLDSNYAESHYNLGISNLNSGNVNDACKNFIEVHRINPYDKNAKSIILKIYKECSSIKNERKRNDFSAVVNFSSLDNPFIDACLDNLIGVAKKVIAVGFNKLFNGKDDSEGIKRIVARNEKKGATFLVLDLPKIEFHSNFILHNLTRLIGFDHVKDTASNVLFIDGDEVPEKTGLTRWLHHYDKDFINLRFANYWYFREPIYQSTRLECSPLIIKSDFLKYIMSTNFEAVAHHIHDRGFYAFEDEVVTPPVFHHFSWVRTKEQLLEKVKTFGHKDDRDWVQLVEEEFTHPFNGRDFVHGYEYKTVYNMFNIKL